MCVSVRLEAVITSLSPKLVLAGVNTEITIVGTGFGSGMPGNGAQYSADGGSSWANCSPSDWVSSTTVTCRRNWTVGEILFKLSVTGPSSTAQSNPATATLRAFNPLSLLWQVESYGAGVLGKEVGTVAARSSRAVIAASSFAAGVQGAGLVLRLLSRSDGAAYSIDRLALAVAVPGSAGRAYFPVSHTPLSFDGVAHPGAVAFPAGAGSVISAAVDFCVAAGQAHDLLLLYHTAAGAANPLFTLNSPRATPVLFSVDDAADPTAADKASWVGLPALTEESRSCGAAWQAHVTVPRTCTPPVVTALSAASIPHDAASTLTLTGSQFGGGTGLLGLSYSDGSSFDVACPPPVWLDATHLRCTVAAGSIPAGTTGVHFRVFVSGMVTVTAQTFDVLGEFDSASQQFDHSARVAMRSGCCV